MTCDDMEPEHLLVRPGVADKISLKMLFLSCHWIESSIFHTYIISQEMTWDDMEPEHLLVGPGDEDNNFR